MYSPGSPTRSDAALIAPATLSTPARASSSLKAGSSGPSSGNPNSFATGSSVVRGRGKYPPLWLRRWASLTGFGPVSLKEGQWADTGS